MCLIRGRLYTRKRRQVLRLMRATWSDLPTDIHCTNYSVIRVSKVASMLNLLTEVSAHLTKHTSVAKLKANQYLQSVGNTLPNYNVSILSLTHSRNIITARLCENTVVWRCY